MAMPSLASTLTTVAESMRAKALLPTGQAWTLAMLAGAYIALAGFGSTVASCNLITVPDTYGLGRCVAGTVMRLQLATVEPNPARAI